jgi:hypothetical protein
MTAQASQHQRGLKPKQATRLLHAIISGHSLSRPEAGATGPSQHAYRCRIQKEISPNESYTSLTQHAQPSHRLLVRLPANSQSTPQALVARLSLPISLIIMQLPGCTTFPFPTPHGHAPSTDGTLPLRVLHPLYLPCGAPRPSHAPCPHATVAYEVSAGLVHTSTDCFSTLGQAFGAKALQLHSRLYWFMYCPICGMLWSTTGCNQNCTCRPQSQPQPSE